MDGHVKDSIFKNKEVLYPNYLPEYLPNRREEVEEISQAVKESLNGKATHVLITGLSGTGKTASVKLIFNRLSRNSVCFT